MKLTDFVIRDAVISNLEATDRNGAIRELVRKVAEVNGLSAEDGETIAKAVIQRENQGSTGFGKGVAVPHVKHAKVPKIMAAIGRSATGIDFAALDRAPVYTIVVLLSPPDNPDGHLQAMENIFRHLQRDNFRRFLRQSETADAIWDLIQEADETPAG
ncbi:MAG: PTS fructose transporter subunit IIA [Planctomycetota bacterium]|nr:MAG: PTS fructose transporter subunit IIA [Planctomycetota bacterium]